MVWVTTPTLIVRPPARPRATGLGTKPSRAMASSTAVRLSGATTAVPLRMRDTVLGETPAAWATISSVTFLSAYPATALFLPARATVLVFMARPLFYGRQFKHDRAGISRPVANRHQSAHAAIELAPACVQRVLFGLGDALPDQRSAVALDEVANGVFQVPPCKSIDTLTAPDDLAAEQAAHAFLRCAAISAELRGFPCAYYAAPVLLQICRAAIQQQLDWVCQPQGLASAVHIRQSRATTRRLAFFN